MRSFVFYSTECLNNYNLTYEDSLYYYNPIVLQHMVIKYQSSPMCPHRRRCYI